MQIFICPFSHYFVECLAVNEISTPVLSLIEVVFPEYMGLLPSGVSRSQMVNPRTGSRAGSSE